ncbi:ERAP1-like C-terminal domain-containing protein, partial [Myxococcota bacterium]|nr:ERAP1-like C-terminal domain-containing protein [Myxococcota bacterium]
RLRAWIQVYFGGQVDALGLEAAPPDDRHRREQRARVLSIVGGLGRSLSIGELCSARTASALAGRGSLAPELFDATVRIAASRGDGALHRDYVAAARQATTPQARRRWLLALAEFPGTREIEASLAAAFDPTLAPTVDRAGLQSALLANPTAAPIAWDRMRRSWKRLERDWPPILLARVAATTATALPATRAREIQAFFRTHPLAAGPRTLRQITEELAIARESAPRLARELEVYLGRPPAA